MISEPCNTREIVKKIADTHSQYLTNTLISLLFDKYNIQPSDREARSVTAFQNICGLDSGRRNILENIYKVVLQCDSAALLCHHIKYFVSVQFGKVLALLQNTGICTDC